jgi:hypothetical protein
MALDMREAVSGELLDGGVQGIIHHVLENGQGT